jgi:copper(I)-binding protein
MTPFLLALPLLLATQFTAVPTDPILGAVSAEHGQIYVNNNVGGDTQAFVQIHNAGPSADTLVSASCAIANTTQLIDQNGKPVSNIAIPPGQTVTLTKATAHLYLQSIHFKVQRGSVVPCTLNFTGAGNIQVLMYYTTPPKS